MAFRSWFSVPLVKADDDEEELVDPLETLRERCKEKTHIEALYNEYQKCNDRVNGKSNTTETCEQEMFDFIGEMDHCVAHTLFSKLK